MKKYRVTLDFHGIQCTFIIEAPWDLSRTRLKDYLESNPTVLAIAEVK
jgi:hypothetical protein